RLRQLSPREASRSLQRWIDFCFEQEGGYSDEVVNLQNMQHWAVNSMYRSHSKIERTIFGLEFEGEFKAICCTDIH
ncbi:unnamed protein product, partial [Heterosigma akashiwo]